MSETNLILIPNNPYAPRICPELAQEIGLNESLLLLQIDFWIRTSTTEEHEGRAWTFQSVRDIQKTFSFWSLATINRTIQSLIDSEYVRIGNFNKLKYDKTRWFALNPQALSQLKSIRIGGYETPLFHSETRSTQDETRSTQDETTIPETTTEISSEITPIASAVSSSEEFAAVFQTVESAMGELEPTECEELRELWNEIPDLEAHHFAVLQTAKYADGFNLRYYRKCLESYARQNHVTQASTEGPTNGNGRRGARADAPALQTERPLRRAAAPDSSRGPVYDPG